MTCFHWHQVYKLPVLFVCEDNRISATTPTGAMTAGTHYTIANLPAGLTAQVKALDATTAQITILGKASAHAAANTIKNLTVTFLDAAFVGGSAAGVKNAAGNLVSVQFNDPYQFVYYAPAPVQVDPTNDWQFYWLQGSNYAYSFGLWWYGVNGQWAQDPANNTLKLETYTQPALCTGAQVPGNLIPLNYGDPIGPTSKYWTPGGSSTPVLTAEECADLTLTYESMRDHKTFMGTGGAIVMNEHTDMAKVLKSISASCRGSCCSPSAGTRAAVCRTS